MPEALYCAPAASGAEDAAGEESKLCVEFADWLELTALDMMPTCRAPVCAAPACGAPSGGKMTGGPAEDAERDVLLLAAAQRPARLAEEDELDAYDADGSAICDCNLGSMEP